MQSRGAAPSNRIAATCVVIGISKRGEVLGMDVRQGNAQAVRGNVPLAEMFGYSNTVRTLSQGRASFTMHFEHYETVPVSLADEIIERRRKANKIR